jgi:hypothetical protein
MASNIASWLGVLAKFDIRLNEASFHVMLTLHGHMTNLLARALIHISSEAAFLNIAAFSWKSTLAPILALSTSEAQLIAAYACAQEVPFCRKLANELGFLQIPTLLFADNHDALCLTQHGHLKGRCKHFDLRWKFIKDCIDTGVLKLVLIASENMIADIGTAARPAPALKIAGAAIYGDLASHQSVTSPLQPNTLGKRKR